jgi:hypothetical protein
MRGNRIRIVRWVLGVGLMTSVAAQGQEATRTAPAESTTTSSGDREAVKGSGTANFIPLWTGVRSLGNSIVFQSGDSVGVGTTTPQATLDVTGSDSTAVQGTTSSTGPFANGVYGLSASTTGNGVAGEVTATKGVNNGVFGRSASTSGIGVSGMATATTGNAYGVIGQTATTGSGAGVLGAATATTGNAGGGFFQTASPNGDGVFGYAAATSGSPHGVKGFIESPSGVAGQFVAHAGSGFILQGLSGSNSAEVFTVDANGSGFFAGNLIVTGTLSKGGGSFKIDHPLDPANKTLSHSFVESPDMMSIYNGVAKLDAGGRAWVTLPDWFESLNGDFRYLLTAIGAPQPKLYVAEEIHGNRFKIAGGKPGGKVSWQLTGIRHDAYANAHRIAVEEDKPATERGYYLHPEAFGQPETKGVKYAHQR